MLGLYLRKNSTVMTSETIFKHLRTFHPRTRRPSGINFTTDGHTLYTQVSRKGTVTNMQEDCSAFEGWIVVIKAAMPQLDNVVLDWEEPVVATTNERLHYNRFIIRTLNFAKSYSWFSVAPDKQHLLDEMEKLLEGGSVTLNYPSKGCDEPTDKGKESESVVERRLVMMWRESCPLTDEQLPVGLFTGEVAGANALTPGGASGLDIWQLDGDTLRIFELKIDGNKKVGIISELLFYVGTLKLLADRVIGYPDLTEVPDFRNFKAVAQAVADGKIRHIEGVFTAPDFHPLLKKLQAPILNILNDNTSGQKYDFKYLTL